MSQEDFNTDDLATYLHLTPMQVMRLASRGKIPGRKVGGEWRFPRAEIHHWLEDRIGISDESELLQVESVLETDRTVQSDTVQIAEILKPDLIFPALPSRTKLKVIDRFCKNIADCGMIWDPEKMADAIRQRESLHPTALDNGVALLHPRRPMPGNIAEHFLALAKTSQGIPFGGPRGQLTDIYFLIASANDQLHLKTLARLSRMISRPQFVSTLRELESSSEILQFITESESELTT